MGLTSLHDFHGSWYLYICRSLFGHSTFFVASLMFMKSTWCCVIRRNLKWNWAVRSCYGKVLYFIGLHDFCSYLHVDRFVEFGTSAICHVLMHCFGSFLLQAVFKSPSICFQRIKYEINRGYVVYLQARQHFFNSLLELLFQLLLPNLTSLSEFTRLRHKSLALPSYQRQKGKLFQ